MQRNERVAAIMNLLTESPGKQYSLSCFVELFASAKSTISEDIDIIRNTLGKFDLGLIESVPGAGGGVRFIPCTGAAKRRELLLNLCCELSRKERILPGGYIYMLDVIYDPEKVSNIARVFASRFYHHDVDYVITVETKGIPLAFATARYLNVPLVVVRHYSEAAEGPSVNINYVSGSSRKLQTMVLSLKALKKKTRLLFIDDFMKGGGTARGIIELAKEFECEVSGIGVLIATSGHERKLCCDFYPLLSLNDVDEENGIVDIQLSKNVCVSEIK
jgi:purine operon repressor